MSLPEHTKETHPTVFRVKYLKQVFERSDYTCKFLISFHTSKTDDEVTTYLLDVAKLGLFEIERCDR